MQNARDGREMNGVILQNCFSVVWEAACTYLEFSASVGVGVTKRRLCWLCQFKT